VKELQKSRPFEVLCEKKRDILDTSPAYLPKFFEIGRRETEALREEGEEEEEEVK
jgi:hypothetical protein